MISYPVYKLIHVLGILMLFLALGGSLVHVINGGLKSDNRWRRAIAIAHGVGLFLILLGGFGMLARIQVNWPWPGWVYVKVIIWLAFGGATALIGRLGRGGSWLWYVLPVLGLLAAYMALYKPF